VSKFRAAREEGHAGSAQFNAFVTKPDAILHHHWIFVQGLSAALSTPAQALQTFFYASLNWLI
jgi:hypothetical protein